MNIQLNYTAALNDSHFFLTVGGKLISICIHFEFIQLVSIEFKLEIQQRLTKTKVGVKETLKLLKRNLIAEWIFKATLSLLHF